MEIRIRFASCLSSKSWAKVSAAIQSAIDPFREITIKCQNVETAHTGAIQ